MNGQYDRIVFGPNRTLCKVFQTKPSNLNILKFETIPQDLKYFTKMYEEQIFTLHHFSSSFLPASSSILDYIQSPLRPEQMSPCDPART